MIQISESIVKFICMHPHYDNINYLEKPLLIQKFNFNFHKEVINYSAGIPKHLKVIEAQFLVHIHSGSGNND